MFLLICPFRWSHALCSGSGWRVSPPKIASPGPWYGKLLPAKLEWLTQVVRRVVSSEKAAGRMGMAGGGWGCWKGYWGWEGVVRASVVPGEDVTYSLQKSHPGVQEVAGAILVWADSFHGLDLLCYPIFFLCPDTWEVPFEEISELQWLGSGAQGAVFLGKFRAEEVAIKKVRDQNETDIKHLRKLKHPNIIAFK